MGLMESLIIYFIIPLGIAIFAYAIVHFQLLLLRKMMDLELNKRIMMRICIATFIGVFLGTLGLSILRGVYNG